MKFLLSMFLLISLSANANQKICEQITSQQNEEDFFKVLGEVNVLTKEQWQKTDVILNFSYKECFEAVAQELIEINGKEYYRFRTTEDRCDGGNSYGSIYSKDLKTPIAHIYDQDLYCKGSWNAEETYESNKCNVKAMELAEKKMKTFGLPFTANHSRVELRDPYAYDYIDIEGNLNNEDQTPVQLRVLVRLETCKFSSVRISNLHL